MTQTVNDTQEDRCMQRLYRDLMEQDVISTVADYSPLGEWLDTATDLYYAHEKQGNQGVKSYLAKLQQKDNKTYNKLVKLISSNMNTETPIAPVGILLSDVKPETIRWLWKPRLALGKVTMLDGDPGLGKSNLTIDLAARVSKGATMPDGTPGISGGVVLITPEDGLADTIQPRLARVGANLHRIVSIGTTPETVKEGFTYNRPFTLPQDLPILEKAIARVQAKLVIIDPVMAILGSKDTYKDNEVRTILAPVQMLIEQAGVCCIMVRHLTKGGGDNTLYRGGGSMAFIALARTGLMVAKDPANDERCIFAHTKTNLGRTAVSLTYQIVSDELEGDDRPYIEWGEVSDVGASDLLSVPRKNVGNNRQDILELLQEQKPTELTPTEVFKTLKEILPNLTEGNVKMTLKRMYDKGEIGKSERGSYHAL